MCSAHMHFESILPQIFARCMLFEQTAKFAVRPPTAKLLPYEYTSRACAGELIWSCCECDGLLDGMGVK